MIQIALQPIARQSLSVQLGGAMYSIDIKDCGQCITATVSRDLVSLVSGIRIVAGTPLLPYRYLEHGNLILTTTGDANPDWRLFGSSQFLVYLSADELAQIRG